MNNSTKFQVIATGFAMFSMFFGAGNVVFPLALGAFAQDQNLYAILGLLITAVCVPFMGLIAMTLFEGNYNIFFSRLGKYPGALLSFFIVALIGPFGALPRCIALSYATSAHFFPSLSLIPFSLGSCVIIYLFSFKRSSILEVLGYFLTPFLLLSLGIIITLGTWNALPSSPSSHEPLWIFFKGLKEGYQTMDLLGAFFFSSVVIVCLRKSTQGTAQPSQSLIRLSLQASFIGAFLLAIVYAGFSQAAASNSELLTAVPIDRLISAIALHTLGPYGGLIVCTAVALACLTTAIALASVFAEYLHENISGGKMRYTTSLLVTLAITGCIATLHFTGIESFLSPILQVIYPALIVLTAVNISYKLFHFQPVKLPFYATLALSLIIYLI